MKLKKNKHVAPPAKIELAYKVLFPKQKKQKVTNKKPRCEQPKPTVKSPQQAPIQRVWRKKIILTKTKPKIKLPRLFRTDQKTGLPLDYERTVAKIMHYVNPHLSSSPTPDQIMKKQLTRTLMGYVEHWNCGNRSPQCLKHHMRLILRNQGSQSMRKDIRNDEDLSRFHCACKRQPIPSEALVPTYKSKFNYNNLRIKSK